MRQVASGALSAARSRSGLCGARLVANTGPWTTASRASRWTHGRSGVRTVTQVVARRRAGQRREVVGAVDRRAVVDVVRARDEDGPDAGLDQAGELVAPRAPPSAAAGRSSRTGRRRRGTGRPSRRARGPRLAANAANWRSRWAAAASPRSAWRAPRCTSAVCSSRSMRWAALLGVSGLRARRPGPASGRSSARRRRPGRRSASLSAGPVAPGTRLRSGRPHRSRLATPSLGGHCDRLVWHARTDAAARGLSAQAATVATARVTRRLRSRGVGWPHTDHRCAPTWDSENGTPGCAAPADSPPRSPTTGLRQTRVCTTASTTRPGGVAA